jgi:hypothetical protein
LVIARTVVTLTTSFTPIAAKPRDSRLGIFSRTFDRFGLKIPAGAYIVTRRSKRDGEFEYRVKSVAEPHERVVRESQLSEVP